MTTIVDKTIVVDVPVRVAYDQWTQFEEFPQFMGGVAEVQQLDNRRLHWVAEIAGVRREWDAEVLQQIPDERVAWAATEGATNAGQVTFSSLGPTRTEVALHLEYEPEGVVEAAGDKIGLVERQAQADLERFKSFIEGRLTATGGWRGSVNETMDVGNVGVDAAADTQEDSGKAGVSGKAVAAGAAVAAAGVAAVAAAAVKKSGDSDDEVTVSGESSAVGAVPTTEGAVGVAGLGSIATPVETVAEPDVVARDENLARRGTDDVLEPVTVVPPNDPRPDTSDPERGVRDVPNR